MKYHDKANSIHTHTHTHTSCYNIQLVSEEKKHTHTHDKRINTQSNVGIGRFTRYYIMRLGRRRTALTRWSQDVLMSALRGGERRWLYNNNVRVASAICQSRSANLTESRRPLSLLLLLSYGRFVHTHTHINIITVIIVILLRRLLLL